MFVACAIIVVVVIAVFFLYVYRKRVAPIQHKYAVFYCYYERDDLYKENFKYFLKHVVGRMEHRDNTDFYITINGDCSVPLHNFPNTTIIRRPNKGFDFGAYSHCVTNYVRKDYDYYVFINSSVRGPFPHDADWKTTFKKLFKRNTNVGIVGVSINMLDRGYAEHFNRPILSHVQSMFFILNHDSFTYLRDNAKFFDDEEELNYTTDMWHIIVKKEIGMSQILLNAGWNLNCILPKYRDRDYRKLQKNINWSCEDPYRKGCYFGGDIKPEDAIFHKISRMV